MKALRIVKSPTCIQGKTLKFGAIYGKIDGIVYAVERFEYEELKAGILTFEFYRECEMIHTKKHGDYVRGGYWQRCSSIAKGKYGNIVSTVIPYIMKNQSYVHQPTEYVRNNQWAELGAPKERKAQNELIFRVANVGYALSPHIMTECDATRKIRAGVTYFPA